jgi:hypothetical protein
LTSNNSIPISYSFNGSSSYLQIGGTGSDWNLASIWTIEWWEYLEEAVSGTTAGPWTVMSQSPSGSNIDFYHQFVGPDSFGATIRLANGNITFAEPTPGQWNHIAVVSNGGSKNAYINGVSEPLLTNGGANFGSTDDLYIGRRGNNNFQYFPGQLSDIRINNTVVYTGGFTPTRNLTNIPGTVLLLTGSLTDGSDSQHTVGNSGTSFASGTTASIVIQSNLLPSADVSYNLGSTGQRWNELNVGSIIAGGTGGTTGQVLTSTGTGIAWSSAICATARSTASQGFTANVSENIQHDVFDFAYGITGTTGANGYFEVPSAGVYKIIPSLQINPTGNGHLHMWLKINGTNAENTTTYIAFKNGEYQVLTTEILLELVANDQVQIWAQSSITGDIIQYIAAGGPSGNTYPAAPGIITNMYKIR